MQPKLPPRDGAFMALGMVLGLLLSVIIHATAA